MSHEIVRCMRCDKIIKQCRCMDHNKATVYDICDDCRKIEKTNNIKPGRYIVTKKSDDDTFQIGDHIIICDDGAIICEEAQGWLTKEEAVAAIPGLEIAIDKEWAMKRFIKLSKEIDDLRKEYGI